jgi:hypothetical protein
LKDKGCAMPEGFAYLEKLRKNVGTYVDTLVFHKNLSALLAVCALCGGEFQCETCYLSPHINAIIETFQSGKV